MTPLKPYTITFTEAELDLIKHILPRQLSDRVSVGDLSMANIILTKIQNRENNS
jgi:hypothetical protein